MAEIGAFLIGWPMAAVVGFTWYVLVILIYSSLVILHDLYRYRRRFAKRSAKPS